MVHDARSTAPMITRTPARVFLALPIDGALDACLDTLLPAIVEEAQGRIVPVSNLHATLAFVGAVPLEDVERLIEIGEALPRAGFELALDTLGSFRGARVAWIAPSMLAPALMTLHAALDARLREAALRVEERPYHPHVTIARHCRRVVATRSLAPIPWPVRRVVLYESVTTPQGPRYDARASWPLEAAG